MSLTPALQYDVYWVSSLGELNSSSTELPVPAGHIRALRERIIFRSVLDSTTYLHTHGKVSRMHGTCSNRSMLITTCTTLKAHLQTLYKIQLQANLLQTASRLSGRETGETSACISCSPLRSYKKKCICFRASICKSNTLSLHTCYRYHLETVSRIDGNSHNEQFRAFMSASLHLSIQ